MDPRRMSPLFPSPTASPAKGELKASASASDLTTEATLVGAAPAAGPNVLGAAWQLSSDLVSMFKESWHSYSTFLEHTSLAFDSMPPNLTPIR